MIKEAYSYVSPNVVFWILFALVSVLFLCVCLSDIKSTPLGVMIAVWIAVLVSVGITILIFVTPSTRMEVLADENFWIEDVVQSGWEIVEQDGRQITLEKYEWE